MKKTIKLTENDLQNIVKKVILEQNTPFSRHDEEGKKIFNQNFSKVLKSLQYLLSQAGYKVADNGILDDATMFALTEYKKLLKNPSGLSR